ncbi:MAG: 16S rRNA (guanine(527)-N(7))-methyltransferase RsmG [Candidatus Peribacteraceae bacterium]|jgi:16S rRNA (guanine527-N7)-methyltransferase|nr:16S rRNA (guanine(527)-N(7))-methyltransferase RsmG [Candidatus Peribacteraceae bacterium]|tara:strand:+ start:3816 stop:4532 length:717 start_codon:yes stop_codon:yes gene_type:complete
MTITDEQQHRLRELQKVFLEENQKLNLSAIREPEAVWIGNISDSVVALDLEIFQKSDLKILDIGTGGGFPLLPLAICKPDSHFTGLDSTQKKLDSITRMTDALELSNVHMLAGRCEQKGRDTQHRESYDIVTARALAPLNVLLEFCAPFVKRGGFIVAWKSMKVDTELEESLLARAELSCHLVDSYTYDLDTTGLPTVDPAKQGEGWGKRQLLVFEKTSETNAKYPREVGIPKKNPLL